MTRRLLSAVLVCWLAAASGIPGEAAGAGEEAPGDAPRRYEIPEARPRELGTPLLDAIAYRKIPTLKRLLANGADPNEPNAIGMVPLHLAVLRGYDDIVRLLLDHGADIDNRAGGSLTPIKSALSYGRQYEDWTNFDILVERGADVLMHRNGVLGMNLLDYATALGEFCRVKPLYQRLDREVLMSLKTEKSTRAFVLERGSVHVDEEKCRLEIVALFEE